MPALIEVRVLEMRRYKPFWGPRRLALELARKGVTPTPSASAWVRTFIGVLKGSTAIRFEPAEAAAGSVSGPLLFDKQRVCGL
jgi:hypothetical protein